MKPIHSDTKEHVAVFWFRRDLRLTDNAGLYYALKSGLPVVPIFIFDTEILDKLENRVDRRVDFIHRSLTNLDREIESHGGDLRVYHAKPLDVFMRLLKQYHIEAVFTNRDYEPYALKRDWEIDHYLQSQQSVLQTYKDQVCYETNEVTKSDGKPYTVFSPYARAWKKRFEENGISSYPSQDYVQHFQQTEPNPILQLADLGFQPTDIVVPAPTVSKQVVEQYEHQRDYPAKRGTSRLGVHLRFGTISIREAFRQACLHSSKWMDELIWREFYAQILWHFPHVVDKAFKPIYDTISWRNDPTEFKAWCEGKTGYPIVDAGMRELNATGFMHNRARMVVASFLTKHLLIDWRLGEAYFAQKLIDFDLASNNGGWQWASSSGCDAAPYFRIFNPYTQASKFDPDNVYIAQWVKEWNTSAYTKPIVEHKFARERALAAYAVIKNKQVAVK